MLKDGLTVEMDVHAVFVYIQSQTSLDGQTNGGEEQLVNPNVSMQKPCIVLVLIVLFAAEFDVLHYVVMRGSDGHFHCFHILEADSQQCAHTHKLSLGMLYQRYRLGFNNQINPVITILLLAYFILFLGTNGEQILDLGSMIYRQKCSKGNIADYTGKGMHRRMKSNVKMPHKIMFRRV